MSRRAVFRADAGARIGTGHVVRCLTLADALAEHGWESLFACTEETVATVPALARYRIVPAGAPEDLPPAELLVVDHYGLDSAYERRARARARRVLVLDDLADRPHDADLLLDQNLGRTAADYAGLLPHGCRLLLGPQWALLRPQFAAARPAALARRQQGGPVRRLLVAFGGTDPDNATGLALEAIARAGLEAAVDVVLGPRAPHLDSVRRQAAALPAARVLTGVEDMAALMAAADLAIGAGGTSSWERCCLGLPTLLVVIAGNQEHIARALADAGAALAAGRMSELSPDGLAALLRATAADSACLATMSECAAGICDGSGINRLAPRLETMGAP